ncbi:MAG: 4-alpha-glucanotransferase [Methylococcales symbiont of Hymedesmia sp. n. MRB-2018]|nr:MAG: 4-alpha-glucanotransferase [Methylococcales symbiont of Hymedesmia sp. n. MRB-2018]
MSSPIASRRAGVLLHISSLPGGDGDFGQQAYNFVDFLHNSGITVWQTLPLGVPHSDGSPYQCLSAHAGNPAFIDIQWLLDKGWLGSKEQDKGYDVLSKSDLLSQSFIDFQKFASSKEKKNFKQFCEEKAGWLNDFSLFFVLRQELENSCWNQWPEPLKNKKPATIKKAVSRLNSSIENVKYEQFVFFSQWIELRAYARDKNVLLFGDIPFFVSYDSSDVWANRKVFKLDKSGEMSVVAGVPPDYFSATGQRWGNPHYDWEYLQKTQFKWWTDRIKTQDELFDIVRIDHFRGLESAWEIPASEDTAINGRWVVAPGKGLLQAIEKECSSIALVAEDLGIITQEVDDLRNEFNLPGMKILHFAFDGNAGNAYLPHNHVQNSVVYSGTHDNDTTLGWFNSLHDHEKHRVYEYLGFSQTAMPFTLVSVALASVANLAIIPMQDILELGSEDRMNVPGTCEGNWSWRFEWGQLTEDQVKRLTHLIKLFGR